MKTQYNFLLFFLLFHGITFCQNSISLNPQWKFRQIATQKWYAAEVPGNIHTDLLANKLIPDPFYRDNETKVQWVEEKDWEYTKSFIVTDGLLSEKEMYLQFDGLDTYADVYLNKKKILHADNMFRQWTAEVKQHLKKGTNTLLVRFYSAAKKAKASKSKEVIPHPDNERIYVRKAQYQFGWDWAPRLVTCGIWKDVKLIKNLTETTLTKNHKPSRDVQLVTKKDAAGESFYFTVNGIPTFIKGANWVPADAFLPRAKKEKRYETLIKAAKEANINMLRVWGGGIYEDDVFYDLCDKYDIMVWQDFMFAGALYPADALFMKNIEAEVRYQVNRLKHHRSIVLWCGNNEIEEAWFNWGWQKQYNYSPADSAQLWMNYKKIFHQLIPGILKEQDPERPYWPSSPSLGWGTDSAYKKGDVHYWGVWWGKEPVEKYAEKTGRFVSEYGMQGMPNIKTIKQFTKPEDWDTASAVMKEHQKHPFGWENIKYYIENKFRTPKNFEDLVYVSQLMQADAIGTAIKAHRMNQPTTMGTMFWQWNDCWPVTSWSAIDYYGRKKAMYYEVKRSFKAIAILSKISGNYLSARVISDTFNNSANVTGLAFFSDFEGKDMGAWPAFSPSHRRSIEQMNWYFDTSSTLADGKKFDPKNQFIVFKLLKDADTLTGDSLPETVAEEILLFTDPKNLNLQVPKITYQINENTIALQSDKFAYGVYINASDGVEFEDNYFHLLPNEKRVIRFTSTTSIDNLKKSLKIKSLADTY